MAYTCRLILMLLCLLAANTATANQVYVDGQGFASLSEAVPSIKDGSTVYLEPGLYAVGAYIRANDLSIIGAKGVVFDDAVADGKAALVLAGKNVLVESIECRNITVKDGNGACIRFEGENLKVRNVVVKNSESGIMTSRVKGFVKIDFSRFENLGSRNGYAHALYVKADLLHVRYSSILSTKKQGSGIKSRSKKVIVENSLLASLDGVDSRLIDMANYGELIVKNNILQQGNNSSNSQLIAYGLERKVERLFDVNRIELTNNLIFYDRAKSNVLISKRLDDEFVNRNNFFVGDFNHSKEMTPGNTWYMSRSDAKLKPYPYVPNIDERQNIINKIKVFGTPNH